MKRIILCGCMFVTHLLGTVPGYAQADLSKAQINKEKCERQSIVKDRYTLNQYGIVVDIFTGKRGGIEGLCFATREGSWRYLGSAALIEEGYAPMNNRLVKLDKGGKLTNDVHYYVSSHGSIGELLMDIYTFRTTKEGIRQLKRNSAMSKNLQDLLTKSFLKGTATPCSWWDKETNNTWRPVSCDTYVPGAK